MLQVLADFQMSVNQLRQGDYTMSHRVLNTKEAAAYLHLTPAVIEKMIKRNEIPHERQGERVIFRRQEIDAWASQRILNLSHTHLAEYHALSSERIRQIGNRETLITSLVSANGIRTDMPSRTRSSIIRDMVALAETTGLVSDPADLLAAIENRELLCSTALPGGVALLHPRHHTPYLTTDSFIVIGRTVQPIHFNALDGKPTDLFFLICCQDDHMHLHTLARLCALYQKTDLLSNLRLAGTADEIMAALLESEQKLLSTM